MMSTQESKQGVTGPAAELVRLFKSGTPIFYQTSGGEWVEATDVQEDQPGGKGILLARAGKEEGVMDYFRASEIRRLQTEAKELGVEDYIAARNRLYDAFQTLNREDASMESKMLRMQAIYEPKMVKHLLGEMGGTLVGEDNWPEIKTQLETWGEGEHAQEARGVFPENVWTLEDIADLSRLAKTREEILRDQLKEELTAYAGDPERIQERVERSGEAVERLSDELEEMFVELDVNTYAQDRDLDEAVKLYRGTSREQKQEFVRDYFEPLLIQALQQKLTGRGSSNWGYAEATLERAIKDPDQSDFPRNWKQADMIELKQMIDQRLEALEAQARKMLAERKMDPDAIQKEQADAEAARERLRKAYRIIGFRHGVDINAYS